MAGNSQCPLCSATTPLIFPPTQALLRFKSGVVAVFEAMLAPQAISDQPFFSLQGTKGEIVFGGFDGKVTLYKGTPTATETWGSATVISNGHWNSSCVVPLHDLDLHAPLIL
jgi:predicted dehydrogenase